MKRPKWERLQPNDVVYACAEVSTFVLSVWRGKVSAHTSNAWVWVDAWLWDIADVDEDPKVIVEGSADSLSKAKAAAEAAIAGLLADQVTG